jgi:dephospho-CoA kinase
MKPVIGIVGGIGSGKSHVASEFASHGGRLIAGDPLGHEGLRQSPLKEQVLSRWGHDILDAAGEIDRRRLGRIVFADPRELRALEAILYPYIGRRIREEIARAQSDPAVRFIVLDAAVMLEAGWDSVCDHIVFVDAPAAVRLERLQHTRGWTAQELERRELNQLPLNEKRKRADAVVDNSGEVKAAPQIFQLLIKWQLLSPTDMIQ